MASTTMHFGPEWMRAKQPNPPRPNATSSSPPPSASSTVSTPANGVHPMTPGTSSYSALLTSQSPHSQHKRDAAYPFKYSREDLLQIWMSGAGRGPLPIEVERWPGVVREAPGEPMNLSELSDIEKKLYGSSSINSEARRRPSADFAAQGGRLGPGYGGALSGTSNSTPGIGGFGGRRRRGDSSGTTDSNPPPLLSVARKQSWPGTPGVLSSSSSTATSRTRLGSGSGFDGVLSGGENGWGGTVKRRGPGQGFPLDGVAETEAGAADANEQHTKTDEESHEAKTRRQDEEQHSSPEALTAAADATSGATDVESLHTDVEKRVLNNTISMNSQACDYADPGQQQQDISSLSKVLWSYIDPSGQTQGPFEGEKMQLWHDQHYFTDTLMMKRTHIDSEFVPLADIRRRAQGEHIFLSPLSDILPPPGLSRIMPVSSHNPLLQRLGSLDSPGQPSPLVHGVSNAHESFLNAHSVSSTSPSSSLGGNIARHTGSPDALVLGGRLQNHRFANELPLNGRLSADSFSSHGSPAAMHHAIRHAFTDGTQQSRSSSFDVQDPNISNIAWQIPPSSENQTRNTSETVQLSQLDRLEQIGLPVSGHSSLVNEAPYTVTGVTTTEPFFTTSNHGPFEQQDHADFMRLNAQQDGQALGDGSFVGEGQQEFAAIPRQVMVAPLTTRFAHDGSHQSSVAPSPTVSRMGSQYQARQTPPPSPWGMPQQAQEKQRTRPFDALDHPTSSNTFVLDSSVSTQRLAWGKGQAELPQAGPNHPWLSHHQGGVSVSWPQLTEEPQRLTVANVNQHNDIMAEQQSQAQLTDVESASHEQLKEPVSVATASESTALARVNRNQDVVAQPHTSTKRKNSTGNNSLAQKGTTEQPHTPPATAPTPAVKSAAPQPQKSAWSVDGDPKLERAPTSLREIQEAEKRKQGAQKVAKRATKAVAASSPTNEEVQYVASWGLPTSQAGARTNGHLKDTVATSAAPTTPVWTNTVKPSAKTMKEIQDEEERQKLSTARRAVQIPAAKGPLPQATTTTASAASGGSGAWTVVGPNGKPSVPTSVMSSRPQVVSSKTGSTAVAIPLPVNLPPVAKPISPAKKQVEEFDGPSLEFFGWLRDSLQKGLDRSVQFEEFAQMLLQFPLDPDQSTIDLIAETIYGASTTLDGRRFAAEFVSKRKADSAARPRNTHAHSSSGALSLANIAKGQASDAGELGTFKVVTKKKRK